MTAVVLTRRQFYGLLAAAAVSSGCGLAAELLLGTLASYLVGNQALAYGVAVGGFLAAMGLGSYLSQFLAQADETQSDRLLVNFFRVELAIAPLTAVLPLALFGVFVADGPLWLGLALTTLILGLLAGMEVPLLTRMVERDRELRTALAGVLALDYAGALAGSLLFPIVLLPVFGMFPSAAIVGALPAWMVWWIGGEFPRMRRWRWWGLVFGVLILLFAGLTRPIGDRLENSLYAAPIVSRQQSAYQRIVLTRFGRDVRLFLDGDLQLSTLDEYRYHEALVHPAIAATTHPHRILLLGAGDGMALREILKWPEVEEVLVVELDPQVVQLAQTYPALVRANERSFDDPRVRVRYGDAFRLVAELDETFDVIFADFPDPDTDSIAKLYSLGFYRQIARHLALEGIFVTQASSPFFAPQAFACIAATLAAADFDVHPYTATVPSFGPWGFVLAGRSPVSLSTLELGVPTRYLTAELLPALFALPADIELGSVQINRLSHPTIVRYQTDPRWAFYD
ncbi:MAG: polyamine aminopropyltransferase [Cyanobacteria bacterium P01_F01_bin.33]